MFRYFIHITFKGTYFHGWQLQENANSVQQEIENCLNILLKEDIKTIGCGRTDAGVHALNFFAHFDIRNKLKGEDLKKLSKKINQILPKSILCYEIFPVPNDLHARYSAKKRTYKYFIARSKMPFFQEYTFFYSKELNLRLMQLACNILKKNKDFSGFAKADSDINNNFCEVFEAEWYYEENRDLLVFTITANRFLRNMVRAIVGTMIDIGREKISLEDLKKIIEAKNRNLAGTSVPPDGLFLWDIEYERFRKFKNTCFFLI